MIAALVQGFLYAYVCYVLEDVCLILITSSSDDFFALKECKLKIVDGEC